ncbi:MAG: hypothetical protein ABIA66_01195 [Candidatus Omnitrophota bacterium]
MRKIIVLTLLMMAMSIPLFAATDWDEFESGRNNIRLEGYHSQPGYVEFQDGDGNVLGYLYWNEDANEPYVVTPSEFNTSYRIGVSDSAISTNIGVPLSTYYGTAGIEP